MLPSLYGRLYPQQPEGPGQNHRLPLLGHMNQRG